MISEASVARLEEKAHRPPRARARRIEVDAPELHRLYHREQLSCAGIARRLKCSESYVRKLMRIHGIPVRSRKLAAKVAFDRGRRVRNMGGYVDAE